MEQGRNRKPQRLDLVHASSHQVKRTGEDFRRSRPLWNGRTVVFVGVLARTDTRSQENGSSVGKRPFVAAYRKTKALKGRLAEGFELSPVCDVFHVLKSLEWLYSLANG